MGNEVSREDVKKYLKEFDNETTTFSIASSIIKGIVVLLITAVILIIGFYITGWALTYLAHKLIESTYYTSIWTRIILGFAWFIIGGIGGTQVIRKANEKISEKVN